jgi:cyanocobalamin reductase (cyanide-eliminating) / alkylcobalamin dealkylase
MVGKEPWVFAHRTGMCRAMIADRIRAVCEEGGLDIVHAYPSGDRLGILIGNTKNLWPRFLARADLSGANPLDDHVVNVVTRALAPFPHRVRFAHDPRPSFVPIQRIAVESGLARLSCTHLAIHPAYGPWIALRAVAEVDAEAPPPNPLPPPRCEGCDVRCGAALALAMKSRDWQSWLAVRDACNVGREWRYDEDQIAYHYTKDRRRLIR